MKLTQVVRQKGFGDNYLGHGYVVYLTDEEAQRLVFIAAERFTAPDAMKIQDFLRHIVRRFIEERS